MGIEQRMESGGDIARHVGITINPRIESKTPISTYKKRQVISRVSKPFVEKIGQPDPVRSVIDSIIPGAAFLPGGSAEGATEIVTKHPDIIVGSVFPPAAIIGGPTGTPGYVAGKAYDEYVVRKVEENPVIPPDFKEQFRKDFSEAYVKFEKDVYTPPKMPDIILPEIKLPEFPDIGGKLAAIGAGIGVAIVIIVGIIAFVFLKGKK